MQEAQETCYLIPGSGRSPGIRNGNSLQDFCLENSMDRENWWAIVHEASKSQMHLNTHTHTHTHRSSLYILDINLSVISFENIFFHSVGCLFFLSMAPFVVQKLLCLIRSIVCFYFYFLCFGDICPKIYCHHLCQNGGLYFFIIKR